MENETEYTLKLSNDSYVEKQVINLKQAFDIKGNENNPLQPWLTSQKDETLPHDSW